MSRLSRYIYNGHICYRLFAIVTGNPANIYLFTLVIETLKKVWNMFKVNNKDTAVQVY